MGVFWEKREGGEVGVQTEKIVLFGNRCLVRKEGREREKEREKVYGAFIEFGGGWMTK